jgi:hypothetical protein
MATKSIILAENITAKYEEIKSREDWSGAKKYAAYEVLSDLMSRAVICEVDLINYEVDILDEIKLNNKMADEAYEEAMLKQAGAL